MHVTTIWNIGATVLVVAAACFWWRTAGQSYSITNRALIVLGAFGLGFFYNGYFAPIGGLAMTISTARELSRRTKTGTRDDGS